MSAARAVLILAVVAAACGGSGTSTIVAGEVRQKTIARTGSTSQACDATHAVACAYGTCCGAPESCVIAVSPVNGGSFCAACPADFPAACTQTNCCKTAGACVVNGTLSNIGTCACPTGQVACGDVCCPKGAGCVSGVCRSCPDSAPTLCGIECRSGPCDSGPGGCSPPTGCGTGWLSSCDNLCYRSSGDCQAAASSKGCTSVSCRQCP